MLAQVQITRWMSRIFWASLICLGVLFTPQTLWAEKAAEKPALDLSDIEKFADTFFTEKMEEYHVPGAAFVLVKDGQIYFSKGYGYADLEKQIPVDPAQTLFRVASTSKVFTIAAVLQLFDQGAINLEEDVNKYLTDWQVKNNFTEPVRVKYLLNHTDGFETRDLDTFAVDASQLKPLGEVLRRDLSSPVQRPGSVVAYGGYGTALAGYLVEEVSGIRFEEYVQKNIFAPLKMQQSSFYQELPTEFLKKVALVYNYEESTNSYEPAQFLYVNTPPTGGLSTTANDIAKFMLALLNGGELAEERILSEKSVEKMLQKQYTSNPQLGGITYGFMEHIYNQQRGILRDGSGVGIRSQIYLLPEHNLGYFYVQNTRGDQVIDEFNEAFLDHYFATAEDVSLSVQGESLVQVKDFVGNYRPTQTAEHTLVKVEALVMGELQVRTTPEGKLTIKPLGSGDVYGGFEKESEWVALAPDFFRRLDRERYLAFGRNEEGNVNILYSGSGYHGSYYKIPWYETSGVQMGILFFFSAVFVIAAIVSLIAEVRRKKESLASHLARLFVIEISVLNLVGIIGALYTLFIKRIAGFPAFAFGVSTPAALMLIILLIAGISNLGLVVSTALAVRGKEWSAGKKAYYAVVILAGLGFLAWLNYWNLFGLKY